MSITETTAPRQKTGARWAQTSGLSLVSGDLPSGGRKFRTRGKPNPQNNLGEFVNEFTLTSLIPAKSNRTFTSVTARTQQGAEMELRILHNSRYETPENQK